LGCLVAACSRARGVPASANMMGCCSRGRLGLMRLGMSTCVTHVGVLSRRMQPCERRVGECEHAGVLPALYSCDLAHVGVPSRRMLLFVRRVGMCKLNGCSTRDQLVGPTKCLPTRMSHSASPASMVKLTIIHFMVTSFRTGGGVMVCTLSSLGNFMHLGFYAT
jgi:hypothetical protein